MTVAMYSDFVYGRDQATGGTKRFLELLNGLLTRGTKVHLFIPEAAVLPQHSHLVRHDLRASGPRTRWIPRSVSNFALNLDVLGALRSLDYDTIVVFDVPNAIHLALLEVPRITLFVRQDFIAGRVLRAGAPAGGSRVRLWAPLWCERFVMSRSSRILVQCTADGATVVRRHPGGERFRQKIGVVYNNVNPSWLTGVKRQLNTARAGATLKIAFVGHVDDPRKGFDILLDAMVTLLGEGAGIELDVVGPTKRESEYAQRTGGSKAIRFRGYLSNPTSVLAETDILVVPSRTDSFPNTILEALYMEMPVIGSTVGGIPEILSYEELLFTPDATSLAAKLRGIIAGRKLDVYREYSKARKAALTFDWVDRVRDALRAPESLGNN